VAPEIVGSSVPLLAPRDVYRSRPVAQPASVSYDPTAGHNPPYGAPINFYLKSKLGEKDRVKLTISDAGGKTVREIECRAAREEAARRPAGPGGPGGGGEEGEGGGSGEGEPGVNRAWGNLQCE